VLHICSDMRRGGAQQLLLDIFRHCHRDRFEFSLFSFRKSDDPVAREIEESGCRVFYANVERPYHNPRILLEILKVLRANHFDIVHTHLHRGGTYGRLVARLCGVPIIVMTEHSSLPVSARPLRYNLENRILEMITDKIIFISEWSANQYHISSKRSVIIKNCIDPSRFVKKLDRDELRQVHGFGPEEMLVGTVANLIHQKGHSCLIEAIPEIIKKFERAKFIFVGWGYLEGSLKKRVKGLEIEKHVLFLGSRDDVPDLIKMFDLFVLPSNFEAFGIVLLEAMINSLAVVATNVGGVPELVEDGNTGFLIPTGDAGALAKAVIKLLLEPELRESFGNAGKERVLKHFTIQRYVSELKKLYEDVLKDKG